ncbi:Stk1 family PASTA domain-containing Ser/Thr kinase [Glaciihabitans sp. UYNi722]|uniref:Stk1 family PASTA domain-containing Ser/Thr kinase n=1 Tax=Glaciihabitans sp. UYNi722 TaxID=3156344 RepID=UPI003396CE5E
MSTNSTDPLIGRLIDGRYQVRSRIARGGMATVYLATDLRLERRVAIKVMHGHLADDSQYKARFIQEARSAARLAHPNVVNVYDQGQDGETAYLVMEYLPGITLRDLLQEHKVLTTVQTMDIMDALLSGLAAAHKNGIVHRDLKPENVLLADDGRIKIGDFGLARAASANTATGNALLGTIAYLSPELVTRGVADTRSDIYAVGIMLYEMLAGEQPFKGEQAFQIAHQHANDTVPTPSSKNPRVPAELDELVLWATARDPDQRPRDARAMLEQLHETEALLRQDDGVTGATAVQRTMVLPTAVDSPSSTAETQILTPKARHRTGPVLTESMTELAAKSDRRRRKGFWLFALVILLTAAAGGTGWYFGAGPGAKVTVQSVSGQTQDAARAALKAQDLVVSDTTTSVFSTTVAKDLVVGTTPKAGTQLAHGTQVSLVVSGGPQLIPVPKLVGLTEDDAKQKIASAKFASKDSTKQFDQKIAEGLVISALGADGSALTEGQNYGEKQPITLVVSLGAIPDVSGQAVGEAKTILSGKNLTGVPAATQEASDTVAKGLVIRAQAQNNGKAVTEGSTVDLIISSGKPQVQVPDVVGKTWTVAKQVIADVGLQVKFKNGISEFLSAAPNSVTVSSVNPKADETVDKGSTVTIALQAGGG